MTTATGKTVLLGISALCLSVLALPALAARKVPPDRLAFYWVLASSATELSVPNSGLNLKTPGCASASYTIGSDGVPRYVRLQKIVPNSDLGATAVAAVKHFRYRAGANNIGQEPVSTYYTVQFNMRDLPQAQKDTLTAACALPGYSSPAKK